MTRCSTHVLDSVLGRPAANLPVVLTGEGVRIEALTDADGRVRFAADLAAGVHRLSFLTGPWFAGAGRETFLPAVEVAFEVRDEEHLHVALLLAPYAYTAYRGS